jgi:hypothetical protein
MAKILLFIEILLSIELRLWHLAGAALAAHFSGAPLECVTARKDS